MRRKKGGASFSYFLSHDKMAEELGPAAKRSKLEDSNAAEEERQVLLSSFSKVVESLEDVVRQGERDCLDAGTVDNYMKLENPKGIKLMFKPMPVYAECMSKHVVTTWKDFEGVVSKHYKDDGVQDLVEELLAAEESYERFIKKREEELVTVEKDTSFCSDDLLTVGKQIPTDLALMEVHSGESKPIVDHCSKAKYTLFILMRHYG